MADDLAALRSDPGITCGSAVVVDAEDAYPCGTVHAVVAIRWDWP